jgi:hypothetical protein
MTDISVDDRAVVIAALGPSGSPIMLSANAKGAVGVASSTEGMQKSMPAHTLSTVASNLALGGAKALKITFVPGATALPAGEPRLLIALDPPNDATRDLWLDETIAAPRLSVAYKNEPQVFEFSSAVAAVGLITKNTGNAAPVLNGAQALIEVLI